MQIEEHGQMIVCSKTLWKKYFCGKQIKMEKHSSICECLWCRDVRKNNDIIIGICPFFLIIGFQTKKNIYLFKII